MKSFRTIAPEWVHTGASSFANLPAAITALAVDADIIISFGGGTTRTRKQR